MSEAFHANLWGACDLITCSGGEQNFIDFRAWLIAQGKERFYKTIHNPESLIEIVNPSNRHKITYETFSYIAQDAYENKTGEEMD